MQSKDDIISSLSAQLAAKTSTSVFTTASTPTPTATPPPGGAIAKTPQSKAWIAGAVVGPILLLMLIALGIFFYRKRRSVPWELQAPGEKAQLHSDSIPAPKYELEDNKNIGLLSELPANEIVGNELEVTGERDGKEIVK